MLSVRENADAVSNAESAVKAHCMCLRFEETGTHYFVAYPEGFRLAGCRVSKATGKARALCTLLTYMERHWQESYPR